MSDCWDCTGVFVSVDGVNGRLQAERVKTRGMYEHLKGFRDFYPGEMRARREVIDSMEAIARRYGFREVGTPALERTELYTDKSGEEIVDQLYSFEDQGGRDIALTPELTPTVARMVVDRGTALSKPIKWFSTRPFWRYEQVQQGRYREFYQLNVDIFGSSEPESDAEILSFCADALTELGLSERDFSFRVSHRDILGGLLESIAATVDVPAAIRAVDKRDKVSTDAYNELLLDAGLSMEQIEEFNSVIESDDLATVRSYSSSDRVGAAVDNLEAVLAAVDDFGAREYCSVSLDTARGLDYYTGVVFECFDSAGEVSRSVFGGGRYDTLIESYGGQPTPAVGVAPGFATLSLLLQRAGVWPAEEFTTDYYILQAGETREEAAAIAQALRRSGNVVETDVRDRSFGAQLDYADTINAETVVIVGERDLAEGLITVKDMGSGEQVEVPIDEFPGAIDTPTYNDFAPTE